MSVSSSEGSPGPTDLAAKYQKIASEYAKIRAQFGVLKKAIVEEQSTSAELKETLRVKDLGMRKAEQEIDSLTFRNLQLTKRVTILQDELDALQAAGKKGKTKEASADVPSSVLKEELQQKILENAHLASLLQEQTEKYESEKFRLVQSNEMYEHELKEYKKMLVEMEETKVSKLESENKQLLLKLSAKEESLQKLNNEIKVLKSKTYERRSENMADDLREKYVRFLQHLGVGDLFRKLILFFENIENCYLKMIDESTSDDFSQCIDSNVTAIGTFITSYCSYCTNITNGEDILSGFDSMIEKINDYVLLLDELMAHLLSGKDEEINQIFKDLISRFKGHWIQFKYCIELYVIYGKSPVDNDECVTAFSDIFRSLRSTCDYFSSYLSDREVESKQLSYNEVLSTLGKIANQSTYIYKNITENKYLINFIVNYRPAKQEEGKMEIAKDCCQLWKDKYEAMSASYLKKIKDLEEQLSCFSVAGIPQRSHSQADIEVPEFELPKFVGIGTESLSLTEQWENREAEITRYFSAKATSLIADRQFAESKATALTSECEALQKRLEHSIECREILEASVKQSQDTVARLQEELTTTTSNYELQLSSLSEHMANMNEKMEVQEREIDILRYQLAGKNAKKGKSK